VIDGRQGDPPVALDVARLPAAALGEHEEAIVPVDIDPDGHRMGRAVGQDGGEVGKGTPRENRAHVVGKGHADLRSGFRG
jgi:hypothetical protein